MILLKVTNVLFQLSKECRKEMQYYKLLAKEVEKRIKTLRPYVDMEPVEVVSGTLELTEAKDKIDEASCLLERYCHPAAPITENVYNTINSNVTIKTADPLDNAMNMMFGFNVSIKSTTKYENSNLKISKGAIELPERDYDCPKKPESMLLNELNQVIKNSELQHKPMLKNGGEEVREALRKKEKGQPVRKKADVIKATAKTESNINDTVQEPDMAQTLRKENSEISDFSFSKDETGQRSNTYYYNTEKEFIPFKMEGSSLRSFTGSLHDINADCSKDSATPLVRQRSYTVLKPSPLLIQHLQLQARNTGVDLKLISMSESLSNLPQLQKKKRRRSWDLETAKSQWSSMALDLKQNTRPGVTLNSNAKTSAKQQSISPYLAHPASKYRKPIPRYAKSPKSDPIQKSKIGLNKFNASVRRGNLKVTRPGTATNKIDKIGGPPIQSKESPPKISDKVISEANDPATKVRELYEKIQKQQLDQMASLVEKQKQEQILLQQVFEEQNNMLFKQLKSICPEPTVEIKQAWCDKDHNAERGPVSLSQLINHAPIASAPQSPVAKALIPRSPVSASPVAAFTFPGNYSHCGDKLKRNHVSNINNYHNARPRTNVVTENNASRKLNYDNSGMTSDNEPLLTDRTNDTMADLNVSFPTDNSDENISCKNSPRQTSSPGIVHRRMIQSNKKCTDNAIRSLETSIQKTMHAVTALTKQRNLVSCTPHEVKLLYYFYCLQLKEISVIN